jgi:glycerophosphoryl diester phosphodiesterase
MCGAGFCMKIIGHRGARGLETENTLESLKVGARSGADRVEFDVWTTRDGVPILLHDADFTHMAGIKKRVFDTNYSEIKKMRTLDGKKFITADEALRTLKGMPVYFEIKDYYLSKGVVNILNKYWERDIWVGSNNHKVLVDLRKVRPDLKIYAGTLWHPIETMHFIRKHRVHGMSLHYRWFNPIIYWFCRYYKLDILLYTVNSPWHIKLIKRVYPSVSIFTDYPDRAVKMVH